MPRTECRMLQKLARPHPRVGVGAADGRRIDHDGRVAVAARGADGERGRRLRHVVERDRVLRRAGVALDALLQQQEALCRSVSTSGPTQVRCITRCSILWSHSRGACTLFAPRSAETCSASAVLRSCCACACALKGHANQLQCHVLLTPGCGSVRTFAKASWSSSFSDCSGQVTLEE